MTEHKCVLESCRFLSEKKDFNVTYLPVKSDGLICLKELQNAITPKTLLVSIMGVHNEIGVIQTLKEIDENCKKNDVFFHTDCSQAIVRISAMMSGGGQERGMRSGTLSPALCVGLGEACKIYSKEMETENKKLTKLKNAFLEGIRSKCDEIYLNGSEEKRVPGNLNLSFAYIEGESLMMGIKNLAVSSGSACTSASLEPS